MPEIKERQILFSAPMVRAILSGEKTVTRRKAKVQPRSKADVGSYGPGQPFIRNPDVTKANPECPYGKTGERLWVREAWAADAQVDSVAPRDLSQGEPIWYPADGGIRQTGCSMVSKGRGRPSIHMPRWASRILLEITEVRVERLQDISEAQALAEGVRLYTDHAELGDWYHVDGIETYSADPRKSFELLWSSINGAESWDANPWVWVVEFKQVLAEGN